MKFTIPNSSFSPIEQKGFPFILLDYQHSNNNKPMGTDYHSHDHHQFLFMVKGNCNALINNDPILIKSGYFLSIHPGTRHRLSFPPRTQSFIDSIHIKLYVPKNYMELFSLPLLSDCRRIKKRINQVLEMIESCSGSEDSLAGMGKNGLMMFLFSQIKAQSGSTGPVLNPRKDERIEDTLLFITDSIRQNPAAHISISMLAERIALHPDYFIRFFHKSCGMSPLQFINKTKLEQVRDRIIFSSKKLKELSKEYGYDNYNFFSNQFQKHFGMRPKQFRRLLSENQGNTKRHF